MTDDKPSNSGSNQDPPEAGTTAVATYDAAMLNELANKGRAQFLQRIGLLQPLSDEAQGSDVFKAGMFTLGFGDDLAVLGSKDSRGRDKASQVLYGSCFRAVVGPWRPHALLIEKRAVLAESFDPFSDAFKAIQEEFLAKRKREGGGAQFGADYLFYLPDLQVFAVYFFSKTARAAIEHVERNSGKLIQISSRLVEAKNNWWVPEVVDLADQTYTPAEGKAHTFALSVFEEVKKKKDPKLAPVGDATTDRPR